MTLRGTEQDIGHGEDVDNYILGFQRLYKILKQLRKIKDQKYFVDMVLAYRHLNQASLNDKQARSWFELLYQIPCKLQTCRAASL